MSASASTAWTGKVAVLSAVTAIAVSVIYLPQPLLTHLASSLGATTAGAGAIATTVQLGYALGIFLLVPLADRLQPRRQITIQLAVLVAALGLTAALPSVAAVGTGFLVVGLVANIPQLIIPVAGRLAPAERRHATTVSLVSALLVGIFGGRIVAGLLSGPLGWRGVMLVFAALVALSIPLVRTALPGDMHIPSRHSYHQLLGATLKRVTTSRPLLQSALMQFFGFATFNSLWTVIVLQLTGDSFGWSVSSAGLFGLVGLAAGVVTPFGAGLLQRWGATRVSGIFLLILAVAVASLTLDADRAVPLAVSMFLLTWANQVLQSANQGRALTANPDGPAQANTIFMVAVFLGGSLGAALGPIAFEAGGMRAVAAQALIFVALFAVVWAATARYETRRRSTAEAALGAAA